MYNFMYRVYLFIYAQEEEEDQNKIVRPFFILSRQNETKFER